MDNRLWRRKEGLTANRQKVEKMQESKMDVGDAQQIWNDNKAIKVLPRMFQEENTLYNWR